MKIYAIRHGQTDYNAQGLVQGGRCNIPLNETGKAQALAAAETLLGKGIGLIVTSPLIRTLQTTEIIAKHLNIGAESILVGEKLYERDFGIYEGTPIGDNKQIILASRRWTENIPTPGGETIREVAQRIFSFLNAEIGNYKSMVKSENDCAILFVVHGHVLRAMNWYFNGLPSADHEPHFEIQNCGIYEYFV